MGGFFQELAKKLAERWLTLLLLPGTFFIAAVWAGQRLGHVDALDWARLNRELAETIATFARQPGGTQATLAAAILLGVTAIGLAVQALAGVTRTLWLGLWPMPFGFLLRPLVDRRRRRWRGRLAVRRELERAYPGATRTAEQQEEINTAAARVNRLSHVKPGRPTWMGDRIHGVEQISVNRYGLDLSFGWSRLWLLLPDTPRIEITAARNAFAAAVATGTWAWPYFLLAIVWWPAALVALGIGLTGWTRARAAIGDLAVLTESALDLHGRLLAISFGVANEESVGPLTVDEGAQVTTAIRKGR